MPIINESVTFFKEPTPDSSRTAIAKLSQRLSNLNPRERESDGRGSKVPVTPDQYSSAKSTLPLISREK